MPEVVSTRLPGDLVRDVAAVAKLTHVKKSDLLRDAIARGLASQRLEHALQVYQKGEVSIGKAAEISGISLSRFMDEMKKANVFFNYSLEDLEADIAWSRR